MINTQDFFADTLSATQRLFGDNDRFAGLLNGFLFDGRPVIDPDGLFDIHNHDPHLNFWLGDESFSQKEHWDTAKRLAPDKADFLLLGVERYEDIDYGLPLRVMMYDAYHYLQQTKEQPDPHMEAPKVELCPRVAAVIYYGEEPWDGHQSLGELFTVPPAPPFDAVGKDVNVHVLDVKRLTPERLQKFDGSVRPLLGFLRYAGEPAQLKAFLTENRALYEHLPQPLCDALFTLTGAEDLRAAAARHTHGDTTDLYAAVCEDVEILPASLFRPEAFELAFNAPARCEKLLGALLGRSDIKIANALCPAQLEEVYREVAPFTLCAADDKGVFYALRVVPAGETLDPPPVNATARRMDRLLIDRLDIDPFVAAPDDLPEVWNLFLYEKDPLGKGLAKYSVEWRIPEMDHKAFNNGSHILLFNGEYRGDDGIGQVMKGLCE